MSKALSTFLAAAGALALFYMMLPAAADSGHEHSDGAEAGGKMLERMRDMHEGHEHAHDFEAIDEMSPQQMQRLMQAMMDIGLTVPPMNADRGRELFVSKGCVVCHEVNGVGGEIGPSLNAADMPSPMNAFEFAARMWRGASAMIQTQEALFGEQISLTGQELLDIVAFAHDEEEQAELSKDDIPPKFDAFIDD